MLTLTIVTVVHVRCQVGSLSTIFPYLVSKTFNLTMRRQSLPRTVSAVTARFFTDSGLLLQSGAEVETALHAGEHVQCTLGMFRYFLKHSVFGGGGWRSHPLWLQQARAKGLASISHQQTHSLAKICWALNPYHDVVHLTIPYSLLQLLHDVIYFHSYLLKVVLSVSPALKHCKMMCVYICVSRMCNQHLDMKPLSVPAMATERGGGWGGKKKLQHISGIFQLMMCGCGSTGEREPLTVLSLFRSPRAPCCIPVHCTYFGNICSAPFFLFYCMVLRTALALSALSRAA